VFAAQHLLDLARVDQRLETVEGPHEVGLDRFSLLRPLNEHLQVVALPAQRFPKLDIFADALAASEGGLGVRLLVPEIRRGDAGFEPAQFFIQTCGVKDSSANQRPA
jgi:hypothetical protein